MMTREQLELAYAHAEQARVAAERAYAATARLAACGRTAFVQP